jgi:carboxyl-terminal processing protease
MLSGLFAWRVGAAEITAEDLHPQRRSTNAVTVESRQSDTAIARVIARILERSHFSRKKFEDQVSSAFLERYLDSLDNLHMYFLQSDLKSFEKYRFELDDLTAGDGDTTPARIIFIRFLERLQQQCNYVTNLLRTEKFEFTDDSRYQLNRKTMPRPKDLEEAKQLWRERLRYEYLQEKLSIGRPDVIRDLVVEKLQAKAGDELAPALENKVSKEKAQALVKLVEASAHLSPQEVGQRVFEKLERDNAEEIIKTITRRYTRVLRYLLEYDNDDVLEIYLTALCHEYDPHTDYMGKSALENFSIGMKLSLFGIGALLRSEDGICKIQELKPGPAQRSGKLKPNDRIIAVAQAEGEPVDVVDMPLRKVVELIRGPKDTEVRLTVIPADAPDPSVRKIVSLVREEIKLEDAEAKAKIYEVPLDEQRAMRLGVIDLPSFYASFELEGRKPGTEPKSTTTDVAKLIRKLVQEQVAGVILDLRRNGGGSLEEAINLAGLFIKEGPIVEVVDADNRVIEDRDENPEVLYDGPLIVLTSRFSASASEIVAGALQDYGRALIVGDKCTHGKGTVQTLQQLANFMRGYPFTNNPGAVKITIRKFYRPSGSSTQRQGVVPDIVLPSVNNEMEVGEAHLDNALPWDKIEPRKFEKLERIAPLREQLKQRSESRLGTDPDFAYIQEDIKQYRESVAEKSVSLNEALRLKEKQELEDRTKARKKEWARRPPGNEITYEIKLKDTEKPGLPPPESKTNTVKTASASEGAKAVIMIGGTNRPPAQVAEKSGATMVTQGTNAAPAAQTVTTSTAVATADDEHVVMPDATLDESKRILIDLVKFIATDNALATTVPRSPKLPVPASGDTAVQSLR